MKYDEWNENDPTEPYHKGEQRLSSFTWEKESSNILCLLVPGHQRAEESVRKSKTRLGIGATVHLTACLWALVIQK